MRVIPYVSVEPHSGHSSDSPRLVRLQALHTVNSGLNATCAALVCRKIFSTNFLMEAAEGSCSPNQIWIIAPALIRG